MNVRMRAVREELRLTREECGKALGVSGGVINNAERGRVKPTNMYIAHFCDVFEVSEHWLRTGEGTMFEHDAIPARTAIAVQKNPILDAIVSTYLKLDDEHRRAVDLYLYELCEKLREGNRLTASDLSKDLTPDQAAE